VKPSLCINDIRRRRSSKLIDNREKETMSDNILKQLTTRGAGGQTPNDNETDVVDDFGSYGFLRGVRDRAIMLELRKKDGSVTALGYAWLERVDFNPSNGITLQFAGQKVEIIGRNLNAEARPNVRLLDAICRHRVPWIREENGGNSLTVDRKSIVIEAIIIEI
jgi:hypothetical protein